MEQVSIVTALLPAVLLLVTAVGGCLVTPGSTAASVMTFVAKRPW